MDDNLRTLATTNHDTTRIYRGLIATDAVTPNDLVEVRIPEYHAGRTFGPCYFTPRPLLSGGLLFPIRNDPCVVALDEHENAELISWWQSDPTSASPPSSPTLVTALPGTPFDGQRIWYNAVPSEGVLWELRYRSASPNSSKWEFLGGSAMAVENTANQATGSGIGNADLTGGPSLTVPLAGFYEVEFGFTHLRTSALGSDAWVAPMTSAAAIPTADAIQFQDFNGSSAVQNMETLSRKIRRTYAAGDNLRFRYTCQYGSTLSNRWMTIRPIRAG